MKNKQIRRIIVLIMCLVFVFNFAVSAYALSAGAAAFTAIAAGVAVAGTLQALGITAGSETASFEEVVTDAVSYLESAGTFVTNGLITMAGLQNPETLQYTSYAQQDMVQTLLEWAFDTSIVVEGVFKNPVEGQTYVPTDYNYAYLVTEYDIPTYKYYKYVYSNDAPVTQGYNDSGMPYFTCAAFFSTCSYDGTNRTGWPPGDRLGSQFDHLILTPCGKNAGTIYESTDDLTIASISSPYVDGVAKPINQLPAYTSWVENAVAVPLPGTATDEDWVPVWLGGTSVDSTVLGGTQAGAQAGTAVDGLTWTESESVPDVDVGSATLADILSAVLSIPQAIVGSIAQALTNFFGISGTADAYAISLTDFFPFCIPFDIYDFLSVLSAEPEAPVFHWEIPVPQLGRTFDIDVDLSPWDPVAAVFRTFELLAFIVGLGMVTREKFLRS